MITDRLQLIGKLSKAHGLKGELYLFASVELKSNFKKTEWVFINFDGLPVPFFVSDINIVSSETAIIKLTKIDSLNEANKLVGLELLIVHDSKKTKALNSDYEFIGYKVVDSIAGLIGEVTEISDYQGNVVLYVKSDLNEEILIPADENIINSIDKKTKTIKVTAPEGLLDLNK